MVGYLLKNTVTEFGSVARGVCQIENGLLTGITERTRIFKKGADAEYTEDGNHFITLPGDTVVSMNLWGFSAKILDELWFRMGAFLREAIKQIRSSASTSFRLLSTSSFQTSPQAYRFFPARRSGTV